MDKDDIDAFLKKIAENSYSEQEHNEFIQWLNSAPLNEVEPILAKMARHYQHLPADTDLQHELLINKIETKLNTAKQLPQHSWLTHNAKALLKVAAVLFLVLSVTFLYSNLWPKQNIVQKQAKLIRIVPGKNQAFLTLADGSNIVLNGAANGVLAKQGSLSIIKLKDGELIYKQAGLKNKISGYNTLTTPRGGQYKVVLADGSKVWLNAASSIKIPLGFSKSERKVALTGEGYFEVAKNKALPFRVAVNKMQVQVYGTHFNITAYPDEASINTTLLEGSVKIINGKQSKMIVPGQQAPVTDHIKVLRVNTDETVEWKKGNFNFSHEDIESIMRKVARWYDVTIEYKGPHTREGFVGTVPRSSEITDVLGTLELTRLVHFKVVERRVIVMK